VDSLLLAQLGRRRRRRGYLSTSRVSFWISWSAVCARTWHRRAVRRRAPVVATLSLLKRFIALGVAASCAVSSCSHHSSVSCNGGEYCNCEGNHECFLGCYDDKCELECSHTEQACGSVCHDDCDASCHDTNECSHSCGDDCILRCYSVHTCGAVCGAGCKYECHDASECGVRVGSSSTLTCDHVGKCDIEADANSVVTCRNAGICNVQCAGACTVICDQVEDAAGCSLTCLGDNRHEVHGNGTYQCS
jgi:hypothetical protein